MLNVPVHIKPHLVSFFFQEMEGEEINYLNFRAKAIKLSFSSSLNKFLLITLSKIETPIKLNNLHLLLAINDEKEYQGSVYNFENSKKNFLAVPEEVNNDVNALLDDFFRMAFIFYVTGHIENSDTPCIAHAINSFITIYELDEFGFEYEGLRRYYYREISKNKKLQIISKKRTSLRKG